MLSVDRIRANVMREEGYSPTPYKDHLGNWTIGWGHLIEWITDKRQHENWLDEDIQSAIKMARYFCGFTWDFLPAERIEVICEMAFQLGSRLLHFEKMQEALKSGDHVRVVAEMLDSKWARQTPERAQRLVKRYEKGGPDRG